jgi:hypothetical protein
MTVKKSYSSHAACVLGCGGNDAAFPMPGLDPLLWWAGMGCVPAREPRSNPKNYQTNPNLNSQPFVNQREIQKHFGFVFKNEPIFSALRMNISKPKHHLRLRKPMQGCARVCTPQGGGAVPNASFKLVFRYCHGAGHGCM